MGPSVIAHHQSLEVRVTVRNHGRNRVKDLPVVLSADGVQLASKTVEVSGDSQVFIVFTCQLQTVGSHLLSVTIDERSVRDADSTVVTADDVARWSIQVIDPVRVGIVSTRASNSKVIDDATFLNLALSPYAVSLVGGAMSEETAGWAEAHAGADPIACEIVQPEEIDDRWLGQMQAVALMNVPKLNDATASRLKSFVEAGGTLMIWSGDALQADWYNKTWGPSSSARMLPLSYGKLSRPNDRSQKTLKLQNQVYSHPALVFFNRSSNGRLDSVDFSSWMKLERQSQAEDQSSKVNPQNKSDAAATNQGKQGLTLLSLENGDPLLGELEVGRGRVLQWSTSCSDRWSNLPLREVFVPLMQQLVLYGATAATPTLNATTGSTLAITLPHALDDNQGPAKGSNQSSKPSPSPKQGKNDKNSNAGVARAPAPESVELLTPDGTRYRLEVRVTSDERSVQFTRTQYPGAYRVTGFGQKPLAIAVSAAPEESNLVSMAQSGLNSLADRLDAQVQPSAAAFWQTELIKQTGREIWRPLLAMLILFLLVELWLQQSLTRAPT